MPAQHYVYKLSPICNGNAPTDKSASSCGLWCSRTVSSGVGLTQHRDEGVEVLDGQQRIGQLPDEQLQETGRVVLFETLPREHAFIKLVFQLLTDGLGNNKHATVTSRCDGVNHVR